MPFSSLGLHAGLLEAVRDLDYQAPTPIQAEAIPLALAGRDLVGCAQTGTGKTAAFVLPLLHRLNGRRSISALIVTPTRELARLIKQSGFDFNQLEDEEADNPLGPYTGAGTIFGATGGVMEAALRTAYAVLTGNELADINFTPARGLKDVKEAKVDVNGTEVRIAVVHQMGNVEPVLEAVRSAIAEKKEPPYHFIEVMACPGGCIGGGGQPIGADLKAIKARLKALYEIDRDESLRVSHKNQQVKRLYEEYLGEPLGEKSHHLLHTTYSRRDIDF